MKARIAKGRPFEAFQDLHENALDIINAVTFGVSDEQSATRQKVNHLGAASRTAIPGRSDGSVAFTKATLDTEAQAFLFLVEVVGWSFKAVIPGLQGRLYRWYPSVAKATKIKEQMIRREIEKGIARLDGNEGEPTRSAMDHIIVRELRAAKKAGRASQLHSRSIYDEVSCS